VQKRLHLNTCKLNFLKCPRCWESTICN